MLEDNWLTVMVFTRCQPTWLHGAMKPTYAGIASIEIEATCRLLAVPPDSWPDVSEGIRVMTNAVATEYRERSQ